MTVSEKSAENIFEYVSNSIFEIAGEDQLLNFKKEFDKNPETDEGKDRLVQDWTRFIRDTKVRTGTLLKTDHLSFLFGAGVSKDAGGVLLGKVPIEVENALLQNGISGKKVDKWLNVFYLATRRLSTNTTNLPFDKTGILKRKVALEEAFAQHDEKKYNELQIQVKFEDLLSLLYRWDDVLKKSDQRLHIMGDLIINITKESLEKCLSKTMSAFIKMCILPQNVETEIALTPFNNFVRKVLTRPLNLRRTSIFTLNYDTLIEKSTDANGVVLIDGFVGTDRRVFRPESYDHDLYFPGDTTEGRVHRLDRVIHLYKLHGSINWVSEDPTWDNPYGISIEKNPPEGSCRLIYPTPSKYGETLGMPYAELFRRFAASVVSPQSTLIVIGYGFGDQHVNTIIRQALAIPSFTLVVVDPFPPDPDPKSEHFIARLRTRKDGRVWVLGGMTFGSFNGFVDNILPDLHGQEVQSKVIATHRALGNIPSTESNFGGDDGK